MHIFLSIIIFLISAVIVTKGADWFTDAAVSIAKITGVPKIIIGSTIVSITTTLPEFVVSVTSAAKGHTELAMGNAVGSCICNIGLCLGVLLLFGASPIFDKRVFNVKCNFMVISAVLLYILSIGGFISRINGILLLFVLLLYTILIIRSLSKSTSKEEHERGDLFGKFLWFILGAVCVILGSQGLIRSGVYIARFLGVSELVIGLGLVAFGTSLPELVTVISALLKGESELSLGNIVGANFLDIAWVLGVSSLVHPLPVASHSMIYDFPVMLLLMCLLIVFTRNRRVSSRWKGGILLLIYGAYIWAIFSLP
jgi:cation:H+ antiporter